MHSVVLELSFIVLGCLLGVVVVVGRVPFQCPSNQVWLLAAGFESVRIEAAEGRNSNWESIAHLVFLPPSIPPLPFRRSQQRKLDKKILCQLGTNAINSMHKYKYMILLQHVFGNGNFGCNKTEDSVKGRCFIFYSQPGMWVKLRGGCVIFFKQKNLGCVSHLTINIPIKLQI